MNQLTVYKQMTASPSDLFHVLRQEIGVKSNCLPFAIKAIEALKSLGNNLTEAEMTKAAHTFLDNWQTLTQGGIVAEDHDKTDFVKRGKVITISARVEAFYRAAARKGYRITDTIVAVPKEDADSTYFKENFYNGEIVYTLEDKRIQTNRKITAERLVTKYFDKFICRLEVADIKQCKRLAMTVCELTSDEVLNAAAASDNGIFKTKWEKYINDYGYEKSRRVITKELNVGSIWNVWTSEMVAKTVIRRALKRVREVLPELKDTIYAFDNESVTQEPNVPDPIEIEIPLEVVDVDIDNLTEQQKDEAREIKRLWTINPKLGKDTANEIITKFNGNNTQELINTYYASIINIKVRKNLYPIIQPMFEAPGRPEGDGSLHCSVCGKEIKSEKSKKYYAEHPGYTVKCFGCNKKEKSDE